MTRSVFATDTNKKKQKDKIEKGSDTKTEGSDGDSDAGDAKPKKRERLCSLCASTEHWTEKCPYVNHCANLIKQNKIVIPQSRPSAQL